jgi:hypothetical protein
LAHLAFSKLESLLFVLATSREAEPRKTDLVAWISSPPWWVAIVEINTLLRFGQMVIT